MLPLLILALAQDHIEWVAVRSQAPGTNPARIFRVITLQAGAMPISEPWANQAPQVAYETTQARPLPDGYWCLSDNPEAVALMGAAITWGNATYSLWLPPNDFTSKRQNCAGLAGKFTGINFPISGISATVSVRIPP